MTIARLGDLLVEARLISRPQLDEALAAQQSSGKRLGRVLVDRGWVTAQQLSQVLSYQLSVPWVSLESAQLDESLLSRFPRELAVKHRFVVVYQRGVGDALTVYVATDDPTNRAGLDECSTALGVTLKPLVADPDAVTRVLHRYYGAPLTIAPVSPLTPEPPPATKTPSATVGALRTVVDAERRPSSAPPVMLDDDDFSLIDGDERPQVLVVGASAEFLRACREAAAAADTNVASVTLAELTRAVKAFDPVAIVVMEDIYAFDRVKFNQLALEASAPLVIWSDDLEPHFLEPVLETARRRAR